MGSAGRRSENRFGQFFFCGGGEGHLLLVGGRTKSLAQPRVQDAGDALHAEALGGQRVTLSPPGDSDITLLRHLLWAPASLTTP